MNENMETGLGFATRSQLACTVSVLYTKDESKHNPSFILLAHENCSAESRKVRLE